VAKQLVRIFRWVALLGWLAFIFCLFAPNHLVGPVQWRNLRDAWTLLMLISLILNWRYRDIPAHYKRPSQALSGTIVVVLTGLAIAVATGWHAHTLTDLITSGLVLLLTSIVAAIVHRFATQNAEEIGEARFRTSGAWSNKTQA
jgi:uncharacterized membrane protein